MKKHFSAQRTSGLLSGHPALPRSCGDRRDVPVLRSAYLLGSGVTRSNCVRKQNSWHSADQFFDLGSTESAKSHKNVGTPSSNSWTSETSTCRSSTSRCRPLWGNAVNLSLVGATRLELSPAS